MELSTPIGSQAFELLNAENESWLADCFIPPSEMGALVGDRSVLVFGQPGSGKTALARALRERYAFTNDRLTWLVVDWRPRLLPVASPSTTSLTHHHVASVLEACGLALAEYLAHHVEAYLQIPDWAKKRLVWFLQHSASEISDVFGPLLEEVPPEGRTLLDQLLVEPIKDPPHAQAPDWMLSELVKGLKPFGLEGIWVLCDGLKSWAQADPERLNHNLTVILSTLSLFERSGLAFKMFLPAELENPLRRSGGVARRRLDVRHLNWNKQNLWQLVEIRLSLALRKDEFHLADLCNAPGWVKWLEWVGGNVPREWLDQVQPVYRYYIENRLERPVDEKTWRRLRRERPPRFWMDEHGRKATVGGREIDLGELSSDVYKMLRYLYQHSNELVTREELHFLVQRELGFIPRLGDRLYESPKDYGGALDTRIYRLRQAIEPDPAEPVLVRTLRGYGIKLVCRW